MLQRLNELLVQFDIYRLVYNNRKPTICPHCGAKEVRKGLLGYPTEKDFYLKFILSSSRFLKELS